MAAKTTDWRPGPTVCRCCLSEGCYKDISTEYFWMGKREVYAEMLLDSLNLTIAYSQSGGPNSNSRLICEMCISRLRDASDFRRQVQECEKTFIQYLDPSTSALPEVEVTSEHLDTQVKVEPMKEEKHLSDDDFEDRGDFGQDDDDDDDLDDQPLTKLVSKMPKKESVDLLDLLDNAKVGEKRKSSSKSKSSPAKKAKKKETAKPTSSKTPKPDKKKKGDDIRSDEAPNGISINELIKTECLPETKLNYEHEEQTRKERVAVLLKKSKICPFRWMKNYYLCFYCRKQFVDPVHLREHNESVHRYMSDADIYTALMKHKKSDLVKVDVTDISCNLCDDVITDLEALKRHLAIKHGEETKLSVGLLPFILSKPDFKCAVCGDIYKEFKLLNQHINVHYQNYICEECGAAFVTPDRLRTHSRSHLNECFPCKDCGKVFKSRGIQKEHYAAVHMRLKRHRCPHCPETFHNYYQRNKHVSKDHGLKIKEYKCNMCSKVFTVSGKLGFHIRSVHLKEKRYACENCDSKFHHKWELYEHNLMRHNGKPTDECNVCKKMYPGKKALSMHLKKTHNKKRFACAYCDKTFGQNSRVKQHAKRHHPAS